MPVYHPDTPFGQAGARAGARWNAATRAWWRLILPGESSAQTWYVISHQDSFGWLELFEGSRVRVCVVPPSPFLHWCQTGEHPLAEHDCVALWEHEWDDSRKRPVITCPRHGFLPLEVALFHEPPTLREWAQGIAHDWPMTQYHFVVTQGMRERHILWQPQPDYNAPPFAYIITLPDRRMEAETYQLLRADERDLLRLAEDLGGTPDTVVGRMVDDTAQKAYEEAQSSVYKYEELIKLLSQIYGKGP